MNIIEKKEKWNTPSIINEDGGRLHRTDECIMEHIKKKEKWDKLLREIYGADKMRTSEDKIYKVLKPQEKIPAKVIELRILFECNNIIFDVEYDTSSSNQDEWEITSFKVVNNPLDNDSNIQEYLDYYLHHIPKLEGISPTILVPCGSNVYFTNVIMEGFSLEEQYDALVKSYRDSNYETDLFVYDIIKLYIWNKNGWEITEKDVISLIAKAENKFLLLNCYPELKNNYSEILIKALQEPEIQERIKEGMEIK